MGFLALDPSKPNTSRASRQVIWCVPSSREARRSGRMSDVSQYAPLAHSISRRSREPFRGLAIGIVPPCIHVMAIAMGKVNHSTQAQKRNASFLPLSFQTGGGKRRRSDDERVQVGCMCSGNRLIEGGDRPCGKNRPYGS